jgi:hypothetical protein
MVSLLHKLQNPPKEKYNPEVDNFLNLEDTSVFNGYYKDFADSMVHPRSKDDYLLIQRIHFLYQILSNIEKNISEIDKINRSLKNIVNIPQSTLDSILEQSKKLNESVLTDLKTADKMIELIDNMNKAGLSDSQKKFIRPFLVDKYNNFLQKIYPQN